MNLTRFSNKPKSKLRRYNHMCDLINLQPHHKLLDVGSGNGYALEDFNQTNPITGIDIETESKIKNQNFNFIHGDARDMKMFKDKEFDYVFSVGLFEHIHPLEDVKKVANEIQRVSKGYIIVVPDRWTIIEPHYHLPFWQHYPAFFKRFLLKNWNIGNYAKNPNGDYEDLNFFTKKEWKELFPGSTVETFNFRGFGLLKNTIIYKRI